MRVTSAQTLPGLTRSAPDVGKPGQSDDKWTTGTRPRHLWTREENMELLECYYRSDPSERGYMKTLLQSPTSRLTSKQLVAQCSNIHNRQLLSQILQQWGARMRGQGEDIIIPTFRDWNDANAVL